MWIVLSLLCLAPEIEVPATVAPLSRLLPELGQRANMKLIAGVNVRDDVVGIASPKRPVRELMDGIAEAVNATWTEEKGTWVLARTKKQEQADVAADVAFRLKRLEVALAQVKTSEPFTDTHAQSLAIRRKEVFAKDEMRVRSEDIGALTASSPTGRFGRRLLEQIGAGNLATLPLNATTVFSTQPTTRQRKLDIPKLDEFYKTLADEQNRYAKALSELEGSPPQRFGHGFDLLDPVPEGPAVALVLVEPTLWGSLRARVKIADASGRHLLLTDVSPPPALAADRREPDRETPIVELDPETAERTPNAKQWPDSLWRRIERPEIHEPLAPYLREVLRTWSSFRSRPVIACISDFLLGMPSPAKQPLAFAQTLMESHHTRKDSDRLIIIRPHQPALCRAMRLNRPALGRFIRRARQDGVVTLSALQVLWAGTDEHQEMAARGYAGELFQPNTLWDPTGLARLIALAGPEQRSSLERTGKLTYGFMNPAQRAWLQKMVYDRRFFNLPAEWTPGVTDRFHDSLQSEPTVAYADGLPNDLMLELDVEEGEGAITGSPETGWTIATFDEIAGGRIDMGVPMPANVLYRMGQVRRYKAKLSLNSIQGFDFSASDVSGAAAKAVPFDQLDPELRERIAARSAALRKQYGIPPL